MKVPLGELLKDSRDWRDKNPTDLHWNGRSIPALGGHVNRDGASAEWPSPRPVEGFALLPRNTPCACGAPMGMKVCDYPLISPLPTAGEGEGGQTFGAMTIHIFRSPRLPGIKKKGQDSSLPLRVFVTTGSACAFLYWPLCFPTEIRLASSLHLVQTRDLGLMRRRPDQFRLAFGLLGDLFHC